jgi:hypothetical protein
MRIDPFNVKIAVKDTISAVWSMCHHGSGECKIVAIGSIYATIDTDYRDRKALTRANIGWSPDT